MKPDPDYLRRLLDALRASPSPWPTTDYLAKSEIEPDEQMLFHLQLLNDGGFVQPVNTDSNFGFKELSGEVEWQDVSLRLTAQGHEFIEALDKKEVWDIIKSQFRGASLRTLFQVGRALFDGYARETIKKYVGDIRIGSSDISVGK